MKNTFRISKLSLMKQIKLQPKRTMIESKRFTSTLNTEEKEDFLLVKHLKTKFPENGN